MPKPTKFKTKERIKKISDDIKNVKLNGLSSESNGFDTVLDTELRGLANGVVAKDMPVSEKITIFRDIEELRNKVISVLEDGLDDPKERYNVASTAAKYLFPQFKSTTNKNDTSIRVIFENINTQKDVKEIQINNTNLIE